MNLTCKADGSETEYESQMSIVLKNRLARWTVKGLRLLPYTGEKVERFFKEEQTSVGKMMKKVAEEMSKNPNKFIDTIKKGTNGVSFTGQEIETTEKNMRKHGFLK